MSSPNKPSRGRSGRTRNGPRSANKNTRESALPQKPTPTISTDRPKTSARNSTTHTAQSSPVIESPVSPASSRSSNRRKRSGAGRGNNVPKINNPPLQDDSLLRPDRSRFPPHTAPVKDRPPHLTHKPPRIPTSSVDVNKDIDALVERVRAAAMAEHRPSTPGSHIDWAIDDDDDSLPDLNDWGIPFLPDPKAHAISPIIVDGLRHLPELSSGLTAAATDKSVKGSPLVHEVQLASSIQKPSIHPSLPPKPQTTSEAHVVSGTHEPAASRHTPSLETQGDILESSPPDENTRGATYRDVSEPVLAEEKSRPERDGLAASIHAPQNATNSTPAPGYRPPRYQQSHHNRAQTVGRPFSRFNQNDTNPSRSPRLGHGGSPKQHMRNYSSPTTANRHPHSRPVLTGDALSRLVKAVGTTVPSAKPTPLT